ncbi:exopolyphosphatase [Mucilaginibacter sp. HMF5004]|uniref:Ppx/GppA phosphatase family protein n=1 Tax=Mucilaginibacter rivuli TaxID=2857527 RepID=UPI001C5F4193|nr:exopolyphosphatase [Mucilaginibacter rivuli]MBW4889330.1 exopolyphosphatase [Mucilaginibacter rivuli]
MQIKEADSKIAERIAVMDLGTNTFHLLIAEVKDGNITEIVKDHEAVKLGEGGISKGFIQPIPYQRGIKTMEKFGREITAHNVGKVKAIATSMLRNAANGRAFIDEVKATSGIQIELIDGQQEAAYIYQGVKASGCLSVDTSLIVDIGGGSVEFILCTQSQILWKQSFEIGAVRLMDRFHQTDPIPHHAIEDLHQYLNDVLQPLFIATQNITIGKLIGSAGAFETFAEIIELHKSTVFDVKRIKSYDFELRDFIDATNTIIRSHHTERAAMKGIISLRVDMIVVASLLTRFVMEKLEIHTVGMSTYSLKEGVLAGLVADQ